MSRAAFLPTPGDPMLLTLWFKYYQRWCDEIDRLYVYLNSPSPPEIINYIKKLVEDRPKTFIIYLDKQIEHGTAIRHMLELATEDHVMLIEDDGFIFKKGKVAQCFNRIESGEVDAVGSRRGSCSLWLYQEASRKWNIDNSGLGDNGPNFWPNFFFCKREDLLKTGMNFAAKHWNEGELIRALGVKAPEELVSDTFGEASLDLRALGLRFAYEPQYHGNTDDMIDYAASTGIWGPDCHWFHVGSLSSGFHGMLKPDHKIDNEHFSTDNEKLELERRITFWKMGLIEASEASVSINITLPYQRALQNLIDSYKLSSSRIDKRVAIYKEVMDA